MRISDWSSDVCSSDLRSVGGAKEPAPQYDEKDQIACVRDRAYDIGRAIDDRRQRRKKTKRQQYLFSVRPHIGRNRRHWCPRVRGMTKYKSGIDRKSTRLNSSH